MRYLILLIPSLALATGGHEPPPPPKPPAPTTQVQGQVQGQEQDQRQTQGQTQGQTLDNRNTNNATSQASNAGVQQTVVTERSAPALGQGSFAIQGCGVAGNAGHSGTGGASFLGFGFTPKQCYDFQLAQAYAAMGAYEVACEVLNKSTAGQRAQRNGVKLPVCSAPVVAAVPLVTQPPSPVVINVEPAPAPVCTKAVKQCVRKMAE